MIPDSPILTINMIARNEEKHIASAIESLLHQSYSAFKLLIVNNGSTDSTGVIANHYQNQDQRVSVVNLEENDPTISFKLMDTIQTPYYMFAAGHDFYSPTFIEKCLALLESDPQIVLAYPRAAWFKGDKVTGEIPGVFDTRGMNRLSRALVVAYGLVEAYQFYGIYRFASFKSLGRYHVIGPDHVILTELALSGSFALVDECLFFLRKADDWGNWEVYRKKHLPGETDGASAFLKMIHAYMNIADRISDPIDRELLKTAFYTCSLLRYRGNLTMFQENIHTLYSRSGFKELHDSMSSINSFIESDLLSICTGNSALTPGDVINAPEHQKPVPTHSSSISVTPQNKPHLDLKPNKILWTRTDSIGDAILAMSMLPHVKARYPEAGLTVLCQKHIAELYETSPHCDNVMTFDRGRVILDEPYRLDLQERLQREQFDLCLNSVYSRELVNDFTVLASGAQVRIGHVGDLSNMAVQDKESNNRGYSRLVPSEGNYKLELERHRDFLRGLGIEDPALEPRLWLTDNDYEFAERTLAEAGFDPEKTIVLFAGVQVWIRRYERYGEVLRDLCKERGYSVIALGSQADFDLNQLNLDALESKHLNLSGKCTLRQSAAIISRCRLAVGAETGLAHMACAVGTPNVILLGGGHFGRFMPYSPQTSIVCLPLECYGCNWQCRYARPHCITDINPRVFRRALNDAISSESDKPRMFTECYDSYQREPHMPGWSMFTNLVPLSQVNIVPVGNAE